MTNDHGNLVVMRSIAISKFKATCLAVIDQVNRSGEPVLVTKRGKPVAEVIPASSSPTQARRLGQLADSGRIVGDVISPIAEDAWEAQSS